MWHTEVSLLGSKTFIKRELYVERSWCKKKVTEVSSLFFLLGALQTLADTFREVPLNVVNVTNVNVSMMIYIYIFLPNVSLFSPRHLVNCNTNGIVYLLTCSCDSSYVSKTILETHHRSHLIMPPQLQLKNPLRDISLQNINISLSQVFGPRVHPHGPQKG